MVLDFWGDDSSMKHSIVLTSIHGEQPIIEKIRKSTNEQSWSCVVAGDTISKEIRSEGKFEFFSISEQLQSNFSYARKAPVRNYCRKNLAYLRAMELGSEVIIETDDDNYPEEGFFYERRKNIDVKSIDAVGHVNVCRYFTEDTKLWPRGFSLGDIKRHLPDYDSLPSEKLYCPVQNGMVNGDPDVDAIYRLIFELPFEFEHKDRAVALKKGSWCSFNTQNTTFFREVFPLMYQPATPMFREADIVRSMVITRILWENNAQVMFHSPNVYQERNEHDLILDLREEVRLYSYVKEISKKLEDLDLSSGYGNLFECMKKCYEVFVFYGIIQNQEFGLIESWFNDLSDLGV